MQREYEICDCAITYFQFCEEDSGGDNYGTAITYINWGDKFDVRIGVDITRLACRVSSTAYFEDAGGTMDLPLDDVSYLWDPDEQKTLPCEVACHEYRLNYNDIYGTNTLKVTSARRCDGESISAGEQISPGQMIKFDNPDCMAKLDDGTVELTGRNIQTDEELTVTGNTATPSYGICWFNDVAITGGGGVPGQLDRARVTAKYYPANEPNRPKCNDSKDLTMVTPEPLNVCNGCDPAIPDTLDATFGGLGGDFAVFNDSHDVIWGGGCKWIALLDGGKKVTVEWPLGPDLWTVEVYAKVGCYKRWSGENDEPCSPQGADYDETTCTDIFCAGSCAASGGATAVIS